MATLDDRLAARHLRTLLETGAIGSLPDGALLDKFTAERGDVAKLAFAALVERHGSMVWRVCRGVLRDDHDADDAFQNTFLVLARRAGSLWRQESVGPWLHGVAFRVAQHSRSALFRRRQREQTGTPHTFDVAVAKGDVAYDRDEIGLAVFEAVERLPKHYRGAVVLCYLEGKTHEQAALELDCPVGTIKSRLLRARARLSRQLERRGVSPALGVLAGLERIRFAETLVPTRLIEITVRSAVGGMGSGELGVLRAVVTTMAQGGLKAMFMHRLKLVASVGLGVSLAVSGATALGWTRAREASAAANVRDRAAASSHAPVTATEPDPTSPPRLADEVKGWGHAPNVNLKLDRNIKHGGAASASFEAVADPDQMFKTMIQAISADEFRGKRVRYSAFVKSEDIDKSAALWMRVDTEKSSPSFDNMMDRSIKGTTDWRKYEIVLDVPGDAEIITFGLLIDWKGKLWVDDMGFEVVGDDVKTTNLVDPANAPEFPEEARAQIKESAAGLRKQKVTKPVNLDFET